MTARVRLRHCMTGMVLGRIIYVLGSLGHCDSATFTVIVAVCSDSFLDPD